MDNFNAQKAVDYLLRTNTKEQALERLNQSTSGMGQWLSWQAREMITLIENMK